MIVSIYAEKTFVKLQHTFMIKILNELGIRETYFNIVKVKYDKRTVNIILSDENLKTFPLRSETNKDAPKKT